MNEDLVQHLRAFKEWIRLPNGIIAYTGLEAATRIVKLEAALVQIAHLNCSRDRFSDEIEKAIYIALEGEQIIDDIGKGWKLNEEGYRCKVLREEYRNIFLLRRKKFTYKAIGDLYQVSHNRARQIFFKYMRLRRVRVLRYLEIRKSRGNQ